VPREAPRPATRTVAAAPAAAVPAVAAVPATAAAPAPAPAAADRILAVAELPAEVQRELPKLAISGGVHSENAAQRMLIVGGQVMSEGAELAPGVTLEQIRSRSAVLRFRGFRYSVPF
jgi:general secretion pathway protein B